MLIKNYQGICRIEYENSRLIVKADIDGWHNEKLVLDEITKKLSDLVDNYTESQDPFPYEPTDCLLSYYCENQRIAEQIARELPKDIKEEREEKHCPISIKKHQEKNNTVCSNAEEITIREVFGLNLNLPSYQRPYRWNKKNIEFFWKDILECENTYDFGIIVFHENNGRYDIVDGQQRLVTLSLMLRSMDSVVANAFIENSSLQGRDSEKNIGYNLQWFRRRKNLLKDERVLLSKILNGTVSVIVMKKLDDALKFFDRMNATGIPLTSTDILKSHHLLALADLKTLSDKAKERWKEIEDFNNESILNDINEFKRKIVEKWERYDSWWLNKRLSEACSLRMMACGQVPYNMDEIWDIEQFRYRKEYNGSRKGLDCPICDGEFFFWYVFNMYTACEMANNSCKKYDRHASNLRGLLYKSKARELFDILVVHLHERYPKEVNSPNFNRVIDLLFSWLAYFCLYSDSLHFSSLRNDAMQEGSLFRLVMDSKTLEDCFDCYCENPLEILDTNGLGYRVEGNGVKYLIRRELRRIYV